MEKIITILFLTILLFGCENSVEPKNEIAIQNKVINSSRQTIYTEVIPLKDVNSVITTIPSANEITATIIASGSLFSALTLNNPLNAESYTTSFRKTINLGIYGTDLAYIGAYNRGDLLADHLKVINNLAIDLDLSQFINREHIEKIKQDGNLTDSIFAMTSGVFVKMDKHLRENERHNTSLLIMVGSWLESIHIATTLTYNSEFDNETLNTKIGEQKIILEKFIMLLNNFKSEPLFGQLIDDLTQLRLLYEGVDLDEKVLFQAMTDTTGKYINRKSADINRTQLAQITIKLNKIRHSIIEPA
jgi:hypothetical protein